MTAIAGKTIWITGASSGIGEALALEASKAGAKLVLSARRAGELERVRAVCAKPEQVALLPLDLARELDAAAAARAAAEAFGPIQMLVNNAGVAQRSLVRDTELSVYRQLMEINFFAPVALTRAVLPSMLAARAGHVVMIGSVVSRIGAPKRAGYSAAKHALAGYTEAAQAELWGDGIRFTLVCPGFVRTRVSIHALTADGRTHGRMDRGQQQGMEASDCAQRIWRAVAEDREEVLIGGREAMAVQLKRFAPALLSRLMRRGRA
ncbi:MAG: SDR family oxidoreductase [Gammaproteobacteria bacterium]|nr:SDR family oxidoreductase [Gammaproteobacteria bacterium]